MSATSFSSPVGDTQSSTIYPPPWINALGFGERYKLAGVQWSIHTGNDLVLDPANSCAGKPIYAIADGEVTCAQLIKDSTWGNIIVIKHTLEDGRMIYSRYGHVEEMTVKKGDQVVRGQQIAAVGNSAGRFVYHLHFDVCVSGILGVQPWHWPGDDRAAVYQHYVDPQSWLQANVTVQPQPNVYSSPRWVLASNGLKVRLSPSTNASWITVLKYGTQVVVDPSVKVVANGYNWIQTRLGATVAWLAVDSVDGRNVFLSETDPTKPAEPASPFFAGATLTVVATDGLKLRASPATNGKILTLMPHNTRVTLASDKLTYQQQIPWLSVKYNEIDGYAAWKTADGTLCLDASKTPATKTTKPLIGIHWIGPTGWSDLADLVSSAAAQGTPVPYVELLNERATITDIRTRSPRTTIGFRVTTMDKVDNPSYAAGYQRMMGLAGFVGYGADVYSIANEWLPRDDPAALALGAQFYCGAMDAANKLHIKITILDLNTGHPNMNDPACLNALRPALAQAERDGHYLGLHYYAAGGNADGDPDADIWEWLAADYPDLKVVISEYGVKEKDCQIVVEEAFSHMLSSLQSRLTSQVAGVALYSLGITWPQCNWYSQKQRYLDYLRS